MTKKERELHVQAYSKLVSAISSLTYDMEDYDCTWPINSIEKLNEVLKLLEQMR